MCSFCLSVASKLVVYEYPPHQALGRCEAAISKGVLLKMYPTFRGKGSVHLMHGLHSKALKAHCETLCAPP